MMLAGTHHGLRGRRASQDLATTVTTSDKGASARRGKITRVMDEVTVAAMRPPPAGLQLLWVSRPWVLTCLEKTVPLSIA